MKRPIQEWLQLAITSPLNTTFSFTHKFVSSRRGVVKLIRITNDGYPIFSLVRDGVVDAHQFRCDEDKFNELDSFVKN